MLKRVNMTRFGYISCKVLLTLHVAQHACFSRDIPISFKLIKEILNEKNLKVSSSYLTYVMKGLIEDGYCERLVLGPKKLVFYRYLLPKYFINE